MFGRRGRLASLVFQPKAVPVRLERHVAVDVRAEERQAGKPEAQAGRWMAERIALARRQDRDGRRHGIQERHACRAVRTVMRHLEDGRVHVMPGVEEHGFALGLDVSCQEEAHLAVDES